MEEQENKIEEVGESKGDKGNMGDVPAFTEASAGERKFAVLLEWTAPLRSFKARDREFFTTLAAIGFLFSAILFLAEGILPVLVLWAAFFVYYALSTRPPEEVLYKITTDGIVAYGDSFLWQEMDSFWFEEKMGQRILKVAVVRSPWQLTMILGNNTDEAVKKVLMDYIPFREIVKKGFVERATEWLSKKVFLEK